MTESRTDEPAQADFPTGAQARGHPGVSHEAIDVYASSDVIDLHIESFIWTRLAGYDLWRRHGRGLFGARFYSQVDLPRLIEAGLTGAVFSIATWPVKRRERRTGKFLENLASLRAILEARPGRVRVVRDHAGYVAARSEGEVALWIGIQGGNALDSEPGDLGRIPGDVVSRITLVHLTGSTIGGSDTFRSGRGQSAFGRGGGLADLGSGRGQSAFGCDRGLTDFGREYVAEMNR